MAYTLTECPDCEGGGILYCLKCEVPCGHDRGCPACGVTGQIVVRVSGLIGTLMRAEDMAWQTHAEALAQRELNYEEER